MANSILEAKSDKPNSLTSLITIVYILAVHFSDISVCQQTGTTIPSILASTSLKTSINISITPVSTLSQNISSTITNLNSISTPSILQPFLSNVTSYIFVIPSSSSHFSSVPTNLTSHILSASSMKRSFQQTISSTGIMTSLPNLSFYASTSQLEFSIIKMKTLVYSSGSIAVLPEQSSQSLMLAKSLSTGFTSKVSSLMNESISLVPSSSNIATSRLTSLTNSSTLTTLFKSTKIFHSSELIDMSSQILNTKSMKVTRPITSSTLQSSMQNISSIIFVSNSSKETLLTSVIDIKESTKLFETSHTSNLVVSSTSPTRIILQASSSQVFLNSFCKLVTTVIKEPCVMISSVSANSLISMKPLLNVTTRISTIMSSQTHATSVNGTQLSTFINKIESSSMKDSSSIHIQPSKSNLLFNSTAVLSSDVKVNTTMPYIYSKTTPLMSTMKIPVSSSVVNIQSVSSSVRIQPLSRFVNFSKQSLTSLKVHQVSSSILPHRSSLMPSSSRQLLLSKSSEASRTLILSNLSFISLSTHLSSNFNQSNPIQVVLSSSQSQELVPKSSRVQNSQSKKRKRRNAEKVNHTSSSMHLNLLSPSVSLPVVAESNQSTMLLVPSSSILSDAASSLVNTSANSINVSTSLDTVKDSIQTIISSFKSPEISSNSGGTSINQQSTLMNNASRTINLLQTSSSMMNATSIKMTISSSNILTVDLISKASNVIKNSISSKMCSKTIIVTISCSTSLITSSFTATIIDSSHTQMSGNSMLQSLTSTLSITKSANFSIQLTSLHTRLVTNATVGLMNITRTVTSTVSIMASNHVINTHSILSSLIHNKTLFANSATLSITPSTVKTLNFTTLVMQSHSHIPNYLTSQLIMSTTFALTTIMNTSSPVNSIFSVQTTLISTILVSRSLKNHTSAQIPVTSTIASKSTSMIKPTTSYSTLQHLTHLKPTQRLTSSYNVPSDVFSTSFSVGQEIQSSVSIIIAPTTSIITTTNPPTTNRPPKNSTLLQIQLIIKDRTVIVDSSTFVRNMEQKLVDTYVAAKSIQQRRKRRAAIKGTSKVEIIRTERNGDNVPIEFEVSEENIVVPPEQASATYNFISHTGLEKRLGFPVSGNVIEVIPSIPYKLSDLLGILMQNSMTSEENQKTFQDTMTSFYKTQSGRNDVVSVTIVEESIKVETASTFTYLEFYYVINNTTQNATTISKFFTTQTLEKVNTALGANLNAIVLPYPANSVIRVKREYLVRMKVRPYVVINTESQKIAYRDSLSQKISDVYLSGKHSSTTKRKRRATGSVETTIEEFFGVGPYDVVFYLKDRGSVINAQDVATILNKVPLNTAQNLLTAQITLAPEPLVSVVTATTDNLKYWIVGVVGGAVLVMFLILFIICWRWKKGGPQPSIKVVSVHDEVDGEELGKKPDLATDAVYEASDGAIMKKDGLSIPLFSGNPKEFTNDDLRRSQRRKIQRSSLKKSQNIGRNNPAYNLNEDDEDDEYSEEEEEEEVEEEEESVDEEDDEEEESVIESRSRTPPQKPKRRLEYFRTPPRNVRTPMRARTPPSVPVRRDVNKRKPLEMTGNEMVNYSVNQSYTADHVPTFSFMNDSKEYKTSPPIRFRTDIESMDTYTKPTGPLPVLNLQQTSLVGTAQTPRTITNPEDNHKTEVERMRNKRRQRDQLFAADRMTSSLRDNDQMNKSWRREQEKINAILEPSAADLRQRKGRLRRKMRRRNKISMAPLDHSYSDLNNRSENIELKDFKPTSRSPVMNRSTEKIYEEISDGDSEISMREARRRIHSLLDDTFNTLKRYQKQIGEDEVESKTPKKPLIKDTRPQRAPGLQPALPDPSQGRPSATPPSGNKKHLSPYVMPQYPQYPVYTDPLVTWDPMERQRYVNQRMGLPMYGQSPASLSMPYGGNPAQNVYITPLQQRPDGMGGMMWSPYVAHVENYGGQTGDVPGENPVPCATDLFPSTPHNTTIDLNDIGSLKRDASSQPLIRAIKEELLKLSHSSKGKSRVRELHPSLPT